LRLHGKRKAVSVKNISCISKTLLQTDARTVFPVSQGVFSAHLDGCIRYLWKTLIPKFSAVGEHLSVPIKTGGYSHLSMLGTHT